MATINDIDARASVGRFLQRQVLTPSADSQADTGEEVRALLETIATSFLLHPQAALPLIFRAKNSLQQIVATDIQVVDFLLKAIGEVNNPTTGIDDVSDLVEAQTALVELDRLQRVGVDIQAFTRYRAAITRFLSDQLAPTLKRRGRKEFERTGSEARQDLFSMLPQFVGTHGVLITQLKALQKSVVDFRSIDLTGMVSLATISRVRASLRRAQSRAVSGTISKTTLAIELLSGAAALESVSKTGDLFDPTIQTGSLPAGRTITLQSPNTAATALSSPLPVDISAESEWFFKGVTDPLGPTPQAYDFEFPGPGVSGRVYVSSEGLNDPIELPLGATLYLFLEGAATENFEVGLSTGSVPLATVISEINTALAGEGGCIRNPGTNGLLIFGDASVTAITVRMNSSGAIGGVYTDLEANPSAHEELGFSDNQSSHSLGVFSADALMRAVQNQIPGVVATLEGDRVRLTSNNTDPRQSSLSFSDVPGLGAPVQGLFGFLDAEAQPPYLELIEGGSALDPEGEGVFIGSVVTAAEEAIAGSSLRTLNGATVTDIQGTQLFFSPLLPRGSDISFTAAAPLVSATQSLTRSLGPLASAFDQDVDNLRLSLSPILSRPTQAQVNDATNVLGSIRARLVQLLDVLESIVVRPDRSEFEGTAVRIIRALEERGLDRASSLLLSGRFSDFFALTKNVASKSSRFMAAMESVVTNDVPQSIIEVDIDDGLRPRGGSPGDPLDLIETEGEEA